MQAPDSDSGLSRRTSRQGVSGPVSGQESHGGASAAGSKMRAGGRARNLCTYSIRYKYKGEARPGQTIFGTCYIFPGPPKHAPSPTIDDATRAVVYSKTCRRAEFLRTRL